MTRAEHLQWCKSRALEYCDASDPDQAFASMVSDVRKHPETEDHMGVMLGIRMRTAGLMSSASQVRDWINGFN